VKKIHLIAFDVPYPANYGGVIVIYYYLKALHALGVKVILHCYLYDGKKPQSHLETLCEEVHYYERKKKLLSAVTHLPFIVNSRRSEKLLERLQQDKLPIFFEGVHTTYWIDHPSLADRKKVVRMHNVEWKYYDSLHKLSANTAKKIYYQIESTRLKKYDAQVAKNADVLFTISPKDQAYYQSMHEQTYYLPAFHANNEVTTAVGLGDFFLFHGNLSVEDNKKAAQYLIEKVFADIPHQLIIAGLSPDDSLIKLAAKHDNVQIEADVTEERMNELLETAQGNILYTYQDNGLKLKLLFALYKGRHCIVNPLMVSNTADLVSLCTVTTDSSEMKSAIYKVDSVPFTQSDIERRSLKLDKGYNNKKNATYSIAIMEKHGFN